MAHLRRDVRARLFFLSDRPRRSGLCSRIGQAIASHSPPSAAFSRDGLRIITASENRTIRLWNAASGTEIAVLRGHENTVNSAAFSPDGSRILTALLAKRELLAEGMLATEIMDQEIARLGELMTLLYPWDEDGRQITGKSVNAYYWASEAAARLSPYACAVSVAALVGGAGDASASCQAYHCERDDPE